MSCSKPKRLKTSSIWTYFTVVDDNLKACRCELCGLILSYRSTVNNLKKHIERRHVTINLNLEKKSNPSNPGSSSQPQPLPPAPAEGAAEPSALDDDPTLAPCDATLAPRPTTSLGKQTNITAFVPKKMSVAQKKKIDKAFLRLFFSDYQPFSIVEDDGFKNFVSALNPNYVLPSRKTISNNLIPLAFEECKRHVQDLLQENEYICLTFDTWTSTVNKGYLAVTGHFLGKEFTLNTVLLDCIVLEGSHTSENLAAEVKKITDAYGITKKIVAVVTDNAPNVVSAVTDYLKLKHWPCFAHTLNLVVQDALKKVSPLIDKCKRIVSHFKRSTAATEKLIKHQKTNGSTDPKKLLQDVATRWNSTYFMISRFVELQEAVRSCLGFINNKDLPVLSEEEWGVLSELCKVLKPFEQVTAKMSGEEYLTGSQIIVLTVGLQSVCSKLISKKFQKPVNDVITELILGLLTRFDNIEYNRLVGVSTFLDPRFKLFAFSEDKFKDSIKKHKISLVASYISEQTPKTNASGSNQNQDERTASSNAAKTTTTSSNDIDDEELEVFGYFDKIMKNVHSQSSGSAQARAIIEIDR